MSIRFLVGLLLLPVVTLLAAESGKIVAFAQDTMANDYRKAQVFEVRDALAKVPDVSFVYSDAKGQTSLLIRQIDRFIRQNVDVIIVGTNDEAAVVPVVAKAYDQGIGVIILDRGIRGEAYTTFINSDNIHIGTIGGRYIAERLSGQGTVLLFEGLQKADVTQLRSKGFLDEIAKYPGIKVLKRTGNYLRRDAIIEMEKLLSEGIHVDAIFSESDSMLSGARTVLEKHGIAPGALITVGCDYTSEAREAIREGRQTGSVLFPLGGNRSVEVALKIMHGETVPKHIVIPVELVTKENVERVTPVF